MRNVPEPFGHVTEVTMTKARDEDVFWPNNRARDIEGLTVTQAKIVQAHGCCAQATLRPCVCMYSFTCPEHGTKCVGTHD